MNPPRQPDYRFVRQPRWILGGFIVLMVGAAFVALGFWQLRRLDERVMANDAIERRLAESPASLDAVLGAGTAPVEAEFRRVWLTGEYLADDEVLLRSRSFKGSSGSHVLTPLLLDDGTVVIVERGWVPLDRGPAPVVEANPPSGRVVVVGLVRPSQAPDDRDAGTEPIAEIATVDLGRLQGQFAVPLAPVYVRLLEQDPPQSGLPLVLDPPDLSRGPHLAYAIQWFLFAGVVLIGYPALIVWTARNAQQPKPRPAEPAPDPADPRA